MAALTIGSTDFLLDGVPHRIISGALHYFRVRPEHWRDRIRKARLMGLNTIETYVAWNYHAPRRGVFDLSGDRDLGGFLDLIAEEGMNAIVRPGPYICAEWFNGGLPVWLTAERDLKLRTRDPRFLALVGEFLDQLAPVLVPRQSDRGGPIVLMQVENEYGAYGNDAHYLQRLVEMYREIGISVPLTTVDQPRNHMLEDGSIPGVLATGSFGSHITERLDTLRRHQPDGPLMCSEFWDGWFDSWGQYHHTTSAEAAARSLDELLARGASVNIYMFHGGTNFGLNNGANDKGVYEPITTSYDYDAPLAEDGSPTQKYWAFREVISRYAPVPDEVPQGRAPAPVITSRLDRVRDWMPELSGPDGPVFDTVPTFEDLGAEALVLYSRTLGAGEGLTAVFHDVRDRAQVFLGGTAVGSVQRDQGDRVIALPRHPDARLDVLVEDLGRVDYGTRLGEWKGLGPVQLGDEMVGEWRATRVDLDPAVLADAVRTRGRALAQGEAVSGPVLLTGTFPATGKADLFLSTLGWSKGFVWVNGFALGRYWSRGPQRTLYVPAPVLRDGDNQVLVAELNGMTDPSVRFVAAPELGPEDL